MAAMDDTILRKRGTKTAGVAWRRDPPGAALSHQLCFGPALFAALGGLTGGRGPRPGPHGSHRSKTCSHGQAAAPGVVPEAFDHYRKEQKRPTSASRGRRPGRFKKLFGRRPHRSGAPLWAVVDGRFTNAAVLKNLPCRTVLIGRVRKDTKLYLPPDERALAPGAARRRLYGDRVPTPEELRSDESIPRQMVKVFAAGKEHDF